MRQVIALHAVPDLRGEAGGIASALPSLCEALENEGVESRILSLASDSGCVLANRTTLLHERSPWAISRRVHAEVAQWAGTAYQNGRGFVCHSHGIWSAINHGLTTAAFSRRSPLVVSLHGMLLPYARLHKARRKTIAWHLYQALDLARAQAIHVTSDAEAAAAAAIGVSAPFAIVPFCVHVPRGDINVRSNHSNASQQIFRQERTLLFLGRVHPIKNLDGLIEAFSLAQIKGWRLRIVGPDDGGHREMLRRMAKERGITEQISFEDATFGEAKARLLANSDLLVLPSHSENFGVVVAEALASGTPAIASTGTPWSVLKTHGCGWWVLPKPDDLAAAIRSASQLSDGALREMGARGRHLVQTQLTWPACGQRMADLYRKLVERREQRQSLPAS